MENTDLRSVNFVGLKLTTIMPFKAPCFMIDVIGPRNSAEN